MSPAPASPPRSITPVPTPLNLPLPPRTPVPPPPDAEPENDDEGTRKTVPSQRPQAAAERALRLAATNGDAVADLNGNPDEESHILFTDPPEEATRIREDRRDPDEEHGPNTLRGGTEAPRIAPTEPMTAAPSDPEAPETDANQLADAEAALRALLDDPCKGSPLPGGSAPDEEQQRGQEALNAILSSPTPHGSREPERQAPTPQPTEMMRSVVVQTPPPAAARRQPKRPAKIPWFVGPVIAVCSGIVGYCAFEIIRPLLLN